MQVWTIQEHGDRREQIWWDAVREGFPAYEEMWRYCAVPQTYRIIDPTVIYVRPDAKYPKLANANYGTFVHLAEAHRELAEARQLEDHNSSYLFFGRLFSAQDVVKRMLSAVREALLEFGVETPNKFEIWLGSEGRGDDWQEFTRVRNIVSDYRLTFVHDIEPVRFGDLIPAPEVIKKYADLSRMAALLADADIVRRDFRPIREVAGQLLASLSSAINPLWEFALVQLQGIDRHGELTAQLVQVTKADEARLEQIRRARVRQQQEAMDTKLHAESSRVADLGQGYWSYSELSASGPPPPRL